MTEEAARCILADKIIDPILTPLVHEAEGYLEAIEKAKVLEDSIKNMNQNIQAIHGVMSIKHKDIVKLLEALAQWEKEK